MDLKNSLEILYKINLLPKNSIYHVEKGGKFAFGCPQTCTTFTFILVLKDGIQERPGNLLECDVQPTFTCGNSSFFIEATFQRVNVLS